MHCKPSMRRKTNFLCRVGSKNFYMSHAATYGDFSWNMGLGAMVADDVSHFGLKMRKQVFAPCLPCSLLTPCPILCIWRTFGAHIRRFSHGISCKHYCHDSNLYVYYLKNGQETDQIYRCMRQRVRRKQEPHRKAGF